MKIQIQAGMFLIIGKLSEKANMKKICEAMKLELDDDVSIDDASDENNAIFECGYKSKYYTISEIRKIFNLEKKSLK